MPAVTDLEVTFLCNIKTQLVKFILSSTLLKLGIAKQPGATSQRPLCPEFRPQVTLVAPSQARVGGVLPPSTFGTAVASAVPNGGQSTGCFEGASLIIGGRGPLTQAFSAGARSSSPRNCGNLHPL